MCFILFVLYFNSLDLSVLRYVIGTYCWIDLTLCRSYKGKTCLSTLFLLSALLLFLFSSLPRIKLDIYNMNCLQIGSFLRDIFPVPTVDRFDGVEIQQNWPGIILPTKLLWCLRPQYFCMHYLSDSSKLDKHYQLWKLGNSSQS